MNTIVEWFVLSIFKNHKAQIRVKRKRITKGKKEEKREKKNMTYTYPMSREHCHGMATSD